MRTLKYFGCITLALALTYCSTKEQPLFVLSSNQEMVDLLAVSHKISNPMIAEVYYNSEKAAVYDSLRKLRGISFSDNAIYSYWHFRETLYAGNTEDAILKTEAYLKQLASYSQKLDRQYLSLFDRLLAIAYIRLGEQENCLLNHTSSSCILPIAELGIHQKARGSEAAIDIIEKLLIETPDDLELTWLLNICYQTLGRYPQDVPKKFLIPVKAFTGANQGIPKFEDIAPMLNVATQGNAGGSITEDFNNDGYLDIVVTSSGLKAGDQMRYYENNGNGGYTDKTSAAGLDGFIGGLNCMQTDFNNDGYADIFVLRGGWLAQSGQHPNSLLQNNGDGTFTDVTKASGLLSFKPTQTAVWADFNNDGWLDLFVGNETSAAQDVFNQNNQGKIYSSEFFVNQKDGTFKDMAKSTGLFFTKFIKGVVSIDANGDGNMDLYLSIMGEKNKLLINQGNLKFVDKANDFKVTEPTVSFPVASFDYNNDGLTDLFVCSYSSSDNTQAYETAFELKGNAPVAALPKLYRNNGDGTFTDATEEAGMNYTIYGMGFNYGDLDNDGYIDLYFGTGDPGFESIVPNRMFRNVEGKYFEEVSFDGGFSNIQKGHGISWADLDNDGDQDIYLTMGGAHEGDIYQNQLLVNPMTGNNWINIELVGSESNKKAIGAEVFLVTSTGQKIHRVVSSGASFGGNSLALEIGLGKAESIESILVKWPATETIQKFEKVGVNQHIRIVEFSGEIEKKAVELVDFKMSADHSEH